MSETFEQYEADAIRAAAPAALDRKARGKAEKPGVQRTDDRLTVTGEPGELADIPAMLARRNIDPNDWIVERAVVNEWESSAMVEGEWIATTLHQLKIFLLAKPKLPADFFGFDPSPWKPPEERPAKLANKPKLYMVTSDLQIPYHDPVFAELQCRLAHDLKIDRWYDAGDEFDLATLGRWQERRPRYIGDEDFFKGLKETKDVGRQVFTDRTSAAPKWCEKHICDSNHLERWETYLLKNAPALWGVVPHIREMAGLPELGWQAHLSDYGSGTYQMAEMEVLPGGIIIHGSEAKPFAGDSIRAELKKRSHIGFIMQGHCNTQAYIRETRGGVGEDRYVQDGVEVGMSGQYRMAYGARRVKDWQKGMAFIEEYLDGCWRIEVVPYNDDRAIRYRGQEWRA